MRMQFVVVGLGLALVACAPSQTSTGPNAPVSSMAPGQYRTTVTFAQGSTGPDAPIMSTEQCVSTAEIADLISDSIQPEDASACSENTIRTENGRIEGRVVCLDPQGSPRTMEISGAYGNNRADMDLAITDQAESGTVTRQGRVTIERLGDCSG